MKKLLLFTLSAGIGVISQAQSSGQTKVPINNSVRGQQYKYVPATIKNQETAGSFKVRTSTPSQGLKSAITEEKIGSTTYDLQTNAAIDRRAFNHGNCKFSTTWTLSTQLTSGWPDRGAGYNYNDGSAWGSFPSARIESVRTGWPSLAITQSGKEVVVSHDPANNVLIMSSRAAYGTGAWTETQLTALAPVAVWPRIVAGGANGETIHLIGLTPPTGLGGTIYNGLDGALLYSRSTDGGATWDIKSIILPGMDSTNYEGIGGDSYSIDAKGDVVVILLSDFSIEPTIWKSTDNGTTWTKTMVWDNGLGKYEETVDMIPCTDSLPSGDGACNVVIDNSGLVHVFSGIIYFCNDDITDGSSNFYPYAVDGMVYWNENMGTGNYSIIGGVIDNDNNGTFDISVNTVPRFANTNNFNSYPSAGVDASNNLYVVYSSITELNDGDEYYRHSYGVKSTDGGTTWTDPVDLTPNDDFAECVFATAAKKADSKFYFWYQKGFDPGLNLTADETNDMEENDIMFVSVDPADFATGINNISENKETVQVYPNPNNGNFAVYLSEKETNNYSISVKNVLGQVVYNSAKTINSNSVVNLQLDYLEPGIYFVSVSNNSKETVKKIVIK